MTSTWAAQADRRLIKIAVPNKGSLADAAALILHEAGYAQRSDSKELVLLDESNGVGSPPLGDGGIDGVECPVERAVILIEQNRCGPE